ncbi:MAG: hypothetical protein H7Y03_03970 [Chitinophagaceae bacterium]|nr:hypothetical protein [Chitinophagaceae bacterium]
MKRIFPGIIAILMAVGAVAFTDGPVKGKDGVKAAYGDPCGSSSKQWYLITLSCAEQTSLSKVRDPFNYSLGSINEVAIECNGNECVCAIYACANLYYAGKPNIDQGTQIYTDLYNFFFYNIERPTMHYKDQMYPDSQRSR